MGLGPLSVILVSSSGAPAVSIGTNDFEPAYDPNYGGAPICDGFGINAQGVPYFDLGGSPPSEAAVLVFSPSGNFVVTKP
jgi:hypothetical protein